MKCLLAICIVFLVFPSFAQTKSVLFIGNSLTYYHEMPHTVQQMCNERNEHFEIAQSTSPGATLCQHLEFNDGKNGARRIKPGERSVTVEKLLSKQWDYVVLQAGTVSILVSENVPNSLEPSIFKLDSIAQKQGARTILYQNFAQLKYPVKYCYPGMFINVMSPGNSAHLPMSENYCSDSFNNCTEEFAVISKGYKSIAEKIKARIAPVGEAFELCKKQHPDIKLYESAVDDHPGEAGAYLIACVFYRVLTGNKSNGLQYHAKLEQDIAVKLQQIADSVQVKSKN